MGIRSEIKVCVLDDKDTGKECMFVLFVKK